MNQTWENGKKPCFGPNYGPYGPNSGSQNFFFKNLAPSVTRYYGQLSSCTVSEKTNDPILGKHSDGWTDGQTDERDFMGRCATNVEHPKKNNLGIAGFLNCFFVEDPTMIVFFLLVIFIKMLIC